jgi:putative thioredoxin
VAQSPWISDTTTPRFEADVIRASLDRPMIVDFWAPWCGPCRQLTPILEKLTTEFAGRFQLVKVNIDENPEVAQAVGVQSIPHVVAFRDQQIVSEFVGVHPEEKLREWLNSILPSKAEELLKKGRALEATDAKGALAAYREAAELDAENAAIKIALARVQLKLNLDDEARKIIADLESRGYLEPEAEKVKSQLELRAAAAEAGRSTKPASRPPPIPPTSICSSNLPTRWPWPIATKRRSRFSWTSSERTKPAWASRRRPRWSASSTRSAPARSSSARIGASSPRPCIEARFPTKPGGVAGALRVCGSPGV